MADPNINITALNPVVTSNGSDLFPTVQGTDGKRTTLQNIATWTSKDYVLASSTVTLAGTDIVGILDASDSNNIKRTTISGISNYVIGQLTAGSSISPDGDESIMVVNSGNNNLIGINELAEYINYDYPLTQPVMTGDAENGDYVLSIDVSTNQSKRYRLDYLWDECLQRISLEPNYSTVNDGHYLYVNQNNSAAKWSIGDLKSHLILEFFTSPSPGSVATNDLITIVDASDSNTLKTITASGISFLTYAQIDSLTAATTLQGDENVLVRQGGIAKRVTIDEISKREFDFATASDITIPTSDLTVASFNVPAGTYEADALCFLLNADRDGFKFSVQPTTSSSNITMFAQMTAGDNTLLDRSFAYSFDTGEISAEWSAASMVDGGGFTNAVVRVKIIFTISSQQDVDFQINRNVPQDPTPVGSMKAGALFKLRKIT